uniref:Uncharacterized protein n=1 Tax=Candidatus Kentrum sp. TUN TaxID=2126343 RepID=A0A451A408_9GAMM|nr:MAG: hypothetical protein BECKTUN1418F_GA0071002_12294 [Candidatus Kentron sp. TUN]VFK70044.1 MAG: hypothetical protein BECKTUN1418E_GA0071001_12314 [Candidatus Kentron sp. TUN]
MLATHPITARNTCHGLNYKVSRLNVLRGKQGNIFNLRKPKRTTPPARVLRAESPYVRQFHGKADFITGSCPPAGMSKRFHANLAWYKLT